MVRSTSNFNYCLLRKWSHCLWARLSFISKSDWTIFSIVLPYKKKKKVSYDMCKGGIHLRYRIINPVTLHSSRTTYAKGPTFYRSTCENWKDKQSNYLIVSSMSKLTILWKTSSSTKERYNFNVYYLSKYVSASVI